MASLNCINGVTNPTLGSLYPPPHEGRGTTTRVAVAACIKACAAAKDGRGRWRAERAALQALQNDGASPAIAAACAAAARRVGEGVAAMR